MIIEESITIIVCFELGRLITLAACMVLLYHMNVAAFHFLINTKLPLKRLLSETGHHKVAEEWA